MRDGHSGAVQQSDEMFCHTCGRRWDVNDANPPECVKPKPKPIIKKDLDLVFRMFLAAEQHHPDITEYLKPKITKKYNKWKQDRIDGATNGQATYGR